MVETAVSLPLMLFVVFACLEFAWAVSKKIEIGNAARVAVRAASLPDATAGGVLEMTTTQMSLAGFAPDEWELVLKPADPSAAIGGDPVTARIEAQYGAVSLGRFGDWLPIPQAISASAVMRKEALD